PAARLGLGPQPRLALGRGAARLGVVERPLVRAPRLLEGRALGGIAVTLGLGRGLGGGALLRLRLAARPPRRLVPAPPRPRPGPRALELLLLRAPDRAGRLLVGEACRVDRRALLGDPPRLGVGRRPLRGLAPGPAGGGELGGRPEVGVDPGLLLRVAARLLL